MFRIAILACGLLLVAGCDSADKEQQLLAAAKASLAKRDVVAASIELKNALDLNPKLVEARLLLATTLLQTGNPAQAEIELRKASEAGATEEQVAPELARALLQAGDHAKLIAQFGSMKLKQPEAQADILLSLAGAYLAQGNQTEARQAAEAAAAARPGMATAAVLLARLDAHGGDLPRALARVDELLAREPTHEAAGLLKADLLSTQPQRAGEALPLMRQVQAAHPESPTAHAAIINLQLREGRTAEALADFEKLKKVAPRAFETLLLQAQFDFAANRFKACTEITDQLLTAAPADARVLLLGGAAYQRQSQWAMAEGLLARALKSRPDLVSARHLLAQIYMGTAMPAKAVEVLQAATQASDASVTSLAMLGEAHLQAGDVRRAEDTFQRALKLDPKDASTRTAVALAQLRRGDAGALAQLETLAAGQGTAAADVALVFENVRRKDSRAALAALDRLETKLPDQAYPPVLRARALIELGDPRAAAASFEKALARQANYFPAVAGLADIDFYAGRHDAARKRLQSLVSAEPKNVRARLALVELETRLGATESSIQAQLAQAIKADPGVPDAHLALIDRLLISGDAQRAQVAAQEATAALPNDQVLMDALGRTQIAVGAHHQAVATFKRLAGLQPRNAVPLVRMADAQLAAGDRAAATQALRQAVAADPGEVTALRMQALMAAQDKRPSEALEIARSVQRMRPKEGLGYALEGELEENAKNWTAAANAYRSALQHTPTTGLAVRLHTSLVAAGKAADADRMAADWQKAQPQDTSFMFHLGDVALQAKQYAQAESRYRAVLTQQPRHVAAMNNLAWLLAHQGKPGAVAMAEQANALLPERAALLDTLATALESEKQMSKAVDVQKRAVELDPRDPALRLRLAELQVRNGDKSGAEKQLDILTQLGPKFERQADVAALRSKL